MDDKNIYPDNEIFNRSHLLLGDETMEKLKNTEVIIFGIGGVGSWTAGTPNRTGSQVLGKTGPLPYRPAGSAA